MRKFALMRSWNVFMINLLFRPGQFQEVSVKQAIALKKFCFGKDLFPKRKIINIVINGKDFMKTCMINNNDLLNWSNACESSIQQPLQLSDKNKQKDRNIWLWCFGYLLLSAERTGTRVQTPNSQQERCL